MHTLRSKWFPNVKLSLICFFAKIVYSLRRFENDAKIFIFPNNLYQVAYEQELPAPTIPFTFTA